jgi:hypothetical protein
MNGFRKFLAYFLIFGTPLGWALLLWAAFRHLHVWLVMFWLKRKLRFGLLTGKQRMVIEPEKGPWS